MMRPSEDCISREWVISFIDAGHLRNPNEKCFSENDVVELVKKAPSVAPTDRTGKWIVDRYCSECEWDKHEAELVCNIPTNYCPNCGADMRGEK